MKAQSQRHRTCHLEKRECVMIRAATPYPFFFFSPPPWCRHQPHMICHHLPPCSASTLAWKRGEEGSSGGGAPR